MRSEQIANEALARYVSGDYSAQDALAIGRHFKDPVEFHEAAQSMRAKALRKVAQREARKALAHRLLINTLATGVTLVLFAGIGAMLALGV